MGCTVREKHVRTNRRTRPAKSDSDQTAMNANSNVDKSANPKFGIKPRNYHMALNALAENQIPMPNNSNAVFDDSGWGYCTEEQLEELLLKNLEFLYNEAINKLMALGYDEEVALKAVLRNGHYYGGMDVLTNIVHNSLAYLNKGDSNDEEPDSEANFTDLRQLEEYTLARMVCLLQKFKPHLSKGDAMWCLLMSDLHVGRARAMEIPILPSSGASGSSDGNGCTSESAGVSGSVEGDVSGGGSAEVAPALSKFHGGWGFGNGGTSEFPMNGFLSYASEMALQREIECPKRFNLSPSMKSLLKRNVAMFAAGFRANAKLFNSQTRPSAASLFGGDTSNGNGTPAEVPEVSQYAKNQDVVNSVMSKFQDLNLDENTTEQVPLDQKDDMILNLVHQIKDLEKQVKERKEWAQEKAMQAARKLSHDLTELKMLRMERDETQRLKKGKETHEETTMKRLKEMESALRKASAQVDRANNAVRKLENENAEIRAEMEASKLSASESVTTCLEIAKREKKYLKRLLAWEKQKTKMQEDIAAEEGKMSELNQELAQVEAATKEAEAKWREEQKAKELVLAQVEEERRLKEASEANNKRKLEALRLKIEIDFQRHKDDLQRLEQEYTRLKEQTTETEHHQSSDFWTDNSNGVNPQGETIARLLHELDRLEEDSQEKEVSRDRECMICMTDEVSVVFLPCAHQVICANCNESYGKKGKVVCPCCRVPIEQRIRVYGASS
ncbi:hypothetical protein BUALT_Bualt05G0057200 [Buddleja alternifolia]|uniref:RING-type domain-containing protein n=1 Tax=Buddleja alternifolia TaxID=168488 RepID=A0AAV6XPS7_9LAMI|nr:hypothetical protein BUALT_Bualt05G0057200 [Buddleja alternifolia]